MKCQVQHVVDSKGYLLPAPYRPDRRIRTLSNLIDCYYVGLHCTYPRPVGDQYEWYACDAYRVLTLAGIKETEYR